RDPASAAEAALLAGGEQSSSGRPGRASARVANDTTQVGFSEQPMGRRGNKLREWCAVGIPGKGRERKRWEPTSLSATRKPIRLGQSGLPGSLRTRATAQ